MSLNFKHIAYKLPFLMFISALLLLASCSSSVRFASGSNSTSYSSSSSTTQGKSKNKDIIVRDNIDGKREKIISEAERWLGTPYCWGGESKDCADCSGFVMEVYKKAGVLLPRTAAEQYKIGKYIPINDAKTGDLVFFQKGNKISHVGIYVGNNSILHASSSSGVIIQDLATFGNSPKFIGCREIIK